MSYFSDSVESPWENFSYKELRCKCGCEKMGMDFDFMDDIQELRDLMGVPFKVTSAYRCPEYNAKISSTGEDGPHTTGKAIDLGISYNIALEVVMLAAGKGFGGIGINQKGKVGTRFIHLDKARDNKTIWSY